MLKLFKFQLWFFACLGVLLVLMAFTGAGGFLFGYDSLPMQVFTLTGTILFYLAAKLWSSDQYRAWRLHVIGLVITAGFFIFDSVATSGLSFIEKLSNLSIYDAGWLIVFAVVPIAITLLVRPKITTKQPSPVMPQ